MSCTNQNDAKPADAKRGNILVVDDEQSVRRALFALLSEHVDVVTASSVEEAKDMLKDRAFDAVLTDFEIGDGSGLEVLEFVNAYRTGTPVIMLTGHGSKELAIQTINNRVFGFMEKPYDPDQLVSMMLRALEKRAAEQVVNNLAAMGQNAGHLVHEMANPLTSICTNLDVLKDEAEATGSKEMADFAESMSRSADRMTSIIRWVKDGLRGKRELSHQLFPMREILDTLKGECMATAARAKVPVIISPGSDIMLSGDRNQIAQVLCNLVNNAVDAVAGLEEKWVVVDAKLVKSHAVITVTDSGKGLPADVRARIFTPLFTTKGKTGTGLGLSIVRKIVEAHGGTVSVNEKCENTQFVVDLPTAA